LEVADGVAQLRTNQSEEGGGTSIKAKMLSEGYTEVMGRRTQSSRHFFNPTNNTYKYMSANLVYKENIVSGTNWVALEEYPIRYIIRLRNTTLKTFESGIELSNYIDQIDNSSIWAIGINTFNGVMAFYLNTQDPINGHAQLLYYPRLKSGRISAYNQPLYAIYTNIYAKVGSNWFNATFNDRSSFSSSNNPKNNLAFFSNTNLLGLKFTSLNVPLLGFNFDISMGIKYNLTDQQFHLITEFRCTDRGFDNIGLGYNILSTPQAEDTPYEVEGFVLFNDTHQKYISKQNLWTHDELLNNSLSKVNIRSKNGEEFTFQFQDMSEVFENDYLQLINYDLPSGDQRKVLLAGMFGYSEGSYLQDTWVEIDPTFSEKQSIDTYDHVVVYDDPDYSAYSDLDVIAMGEAIGYGTLRSFESWNTSIFEEIESITNADMTFYLVSEDIETGEYFAFGLYNKTGDSDKIWDETEGSASPQTAFDQSLFYSDTSFWSPQSAGNQSVPSSALDDLLEAWRLHHNLNPSTEEMIPLKLYEGTGIDEGTDDGCSIRESSYAGSSSHPTLTFDYTLVVSDPPEIDSPSDKELEVGFTDENVTWVPTERSYEPDSFVVLKNGSLFDSGSWTNQTPLVIDIDSLNSSQGYWNLTITINDTLDLNDFDTVFVNVSQPPSLPPEIDSPSDKELEEGFSNENISWIPTERTNGTDTYIIELDSTINQSGSWSNQTPIVIDLTFLNSSVGYYNFTITINDTIDLIASDTVFVNITALQYGYYDYASVETVQSLDFSIPLASIIESSTIPALTGIRYQLILNTFYQYYNGSTWSNRTSSQNDSFYYNHEANNVSIVHTNIPSIASSGSLKFVAFLYNGANSTPSLDSVFINSTSQPIYTELRLMANNSRAFLDFYYDFMLVDITSDFSIQDMNATTSINISIGLVIASTSSTFEIIPVVDLLFDDNGIFHEPTIDFNSRRIAESGSFSRSYTIPNTLSVNDIIMVIDRSPSVFQSGSSILNIEYWKDDFEVDPNFFDDVTDFDNPIDFILFGLLLPLILISTNNIWIQIMGLGFLISYIALIYWLTRTILDEVF
jgi:hypothetical protein